MCKHYIIVVFLVGGAGHLDLAGYFTRSYQNSLREGVIVFSERLERWCALKHQPTNATLLGEGKAIGTRSGRDPPSIVWIHLTVRPKFGYFSHVSLMELQPVKSKR